MQTIVNILGKAGGWHAGLCLQIENEPYMPLVIEALCELGPMGLPVLSVAHYGEQNGDLMRDPEMCFEVRTTGGLLLDPFYYRNDYLGIEQWSRSTTDARLARLSASYDQHRRFAEQWDRNLDQQGFLDAYLQQQSSRA